MTMKSHAFTVNLRPEEATLAQQASVDPHNMLDLLKPLLPSDMVQATSSAE
jgi:hypothetical protein